MISGDSTLHLLQKKHYYDFQLILIFILMNKSTHLDQNGQEQNSIFVPL